MSTMQRLEAAAANAAKHAAYLRGLLEQARSSDITPEEAEKRLRMESEFYADELTTSGK